MKNTARLSGYKKSEKLYLKTIASAPSSCNNKFKAAVPERSKMKPYGIKSSKRSRLISTKRETI